MMATRNENASVMALVSTTSPQVNLSTAFESCSASKSNKAVIIGIYGVLGSGKTFLLDQLKKELGQEDFAF